MNLLPAFLRPRTGRRRKVRRMGNLSTHVEFYIYIIAALVILASLAVSLYKP